MADQYLKLGRIAGFSGSDELKIKLHDNGDGTFSLAAFTGATSAVTPVESTVAVAATSTAVLAANSSRKFLLLVNDSDTDIYLSTVGAAAVNAGIRLAANGGAWMLDAAIITTAIKAIHGASGTKRLLVVEGT